MTEEIETLETTPEVTPDIPAPVPELPEQTHAYQPTDDAGRPLGGKQVIKYRTSEELAQKLTDQNILLVRKLRETTRKQRLGISEIEDIPTDAQRFESVVEFNPRQLSLDERVRLSRDILDPEKFDEASDALLESRLGAAPGKIAKTLTDLQLANLKLTAKVESQAWMGSNPGYYPCKDNFDVLTNWMLKNDLAPIRENFQLAFETLTAAGLLLDAPIVREEVPQPIPAPPVQPTTEQITEPTLANSQPAQMNDGRITVDDSAQTKRPVPIPTGLTRNHAADTGSPRPIGDEIVYEIVSRDARGNATGKRVFRGLAALDVMPADEYGRLLRDPKMRPMVERLENSRGKSA